MKEHSTTYGLFKGISPKSDKASGLSCQFANTQIGVYVEKPNPHCGKLHIKVIDFSSEISK